jgi:predicted AlkP superfamily phosphohydrolase/phosphomutase
MVAERQTRVLAVGIDSAEPTLIRALIDDGELPALAGLLERGRWALVDAGGDIGSGAVWPTFFTGSNPHEHQMYSGWSWRPELMACRGPGAARLTPFWRSLSEAGTSVGVLEVPLAPVGEVGAGFEIADYGPHDIGYGAPTIRGATAEALVAAAPRHPFYKVPHGPGHGESVEDKRKLSAAGIEGARLRGELAVRLIEDAGPDLMIVGFTEVHHTTHQLWHTIAPEDPMYDGIDTPAVKPDLVDVYREVDRQIGRMVAAAGPDTAVIAFSLHGMKPGPGIPLLHEAVIEGLGFAARSSWRGLSRRERRASAFNALKRSTPDAVKRLYHARTNYATRRRLAQSTIVPPHDWSRTRAFVLPSDQRGYIRVNLAGREAEGIVRESEYEAVCDEVVAATMSLRDAHGNPLATEVMQPGVEAGGPPPNLPDLIVDWAPAAFAPSLRAFSGATELPVRRIRLDMTGQHERYGFCIFDARLGEDPGETVAGEDLHRLLVAPFGATPAAASR